MSPHAERLYLERVEQQRAENRRLWTASYSEAADTIGVRRASIHASRRMNEKRWFCERNDCEYLVVREFAPQCPTHRITMHVLVGHPGGAS